MTTQTADRVMAGGAEATATEPIDVNDPSLSRFDLVREGMRRDGVEIVYYEPRFPVPGTKEEKRIVRFITFCFLMTGVASLAFLAAFIWWPWEYEPGANINKWYTPVLGITMGVALLGIGVGLTVWAKKLLPDEVVVQERHDGPSPDDERKITGATLLHIGEETGLARRPLLKGALTLGLAPVGLMAAAPLVGGLIQRPGDLLVTTGWGPGVRLVHEDGTPVRPEDVSVGGQITVFPGVPGGTRGATAGDSATLLIHLRPEDAEETRRNALPINRGAQWGNFVAYSKICTHAGCPASLYEQQSNRLLCPCHQSQFLITDNARPVFGPAARRLPQLPIEVDEEGFFVAKSDYLTPVGPSFWERE